MTTLHYRTVEGAYIGGFGDGAKPPPDAIECPAPPDANATWDGQEWVASAAPVPAVVSSFQAKEALRDAGLYDAADAAATDAGGRTLRAWHGATEFQRDSSGIAAMAATLELTDAQVDDLFRAAALISA